MRYRFEEFELDAALRTLRREGSPLEVQPKVLDLLIFLVRHRQRAASREELLVPGSSTRNAWAPGAAGAHQSNSTAKPARVSPGAIPLRRGASEPADLSDPPEPLDPSGSSESRPRAVEVTKRSHESGPRPN